MAAAAGVVQLFTWDGGCALAGTGTVIGLHSHHALQLVLSQSGTVGLRASDDEPWVAYTAGLVASRQPHTMDATAAGYGTVVLVEPESREGQALQQLCDDRGIVSVASDSVAAATAAYFDIWLARRSRPDVVAAIRNVIRAITNEVDTPPPTDERILRAVAFINANLDRSLTLNEVAKEVFLSPGRFRHLFVEQTGMAMRPYVLWRRFMKVWTHTMNGESLSSAAHAAGFADSAHLTRTCWRMFGIPPSLFQVMNEVPPPPPAPKARAG
jgi:AraC family transcriptional regulator